MLVMLRKTYILSIIAVFLFAISACSEDEPVNPSVRSEERAGLKIMPLGASRVEGARPFFESYRYELWKLMVDENWEFDFIGTVEDDASYPTYNNIRFDVDHEGRGGWTSGQILSGVEGWIERAGTPDIVLFSSPGGNDALQGLNYDQALENINAIIDIIQRANPSATIIIEQLAPGQSEIMTGDLLNYFIRMQSDVVTIAENQTTSTSAVIAVDMFTGFSDSLLADDVHYNEAGAAFIAERYLSALAPYFD